jgi:O-antigen ligase
LAFTFGLYLLERVRPITPGRQDTATLPKSGRLASPLFFFFVSLLIFVGILYSRSRMGILSAVAASLATWVLWLSSAWRRSVAVLVLVAFLAATMLFSIWIGLGPVAERYETIERDYTFRLAVWKDTARLIKVHPVFGTGLGTFADVYPQFQTVFLTRLVDHAHSDYLEFSAELGILGAAILFGTIGTALAKGVSAFYRLRQERERFLALGSCSSILAILFHSFADFNLQIPANALVFAVILALACSFSSPQPSQRT